MSRRSRGHRAPLSEAPLSSDSPSPEGDDTEALADALFGDAPSFDRKTLQLCREVERLVGSAFAVGLDDDLLNSLVVLQVTPLAGASRLQVVLAPTVPLPVEDGEVRARLERLRPQLRSAVAQHIQRKRAPELELLLLPTLAGEVEE